MPKADRESEAAGPLARFSMEQRRSRGFDSRPPASLQGLGGKRSRLVAYRWGRFRGELVLHTRN
jgi:hypothetical protein